MYICKKNTICYIVSLHQLGMQTQKLLKVHKVYNFIMTIIKAYKSESLPIGAVRNEPHHEKTNNLHICENKDADQLRVQRF